MIGFYSKLVQEALDKYRAVFENGLGTYSMKHTATEAEIVDAINSAIADGQELDQKTHPIFVQIPKGALL